MFYLYLTEWCHIYSLPGHLYLALLELLFFDEYIWSQLYMISSMRHMISSGSFAFHRHVFSCPLHFPLYAQVSSTMHSCRMTTSSMSDKKSFSYLIFWEVWCYLHLFLLLRQKNLVSDSTPIIWLLFFYFGMDLCDTEDSFSNYWDLLSAPT